MYAFLSPSSEHLKQVSPSPKKTKFSLATLFKTGDSAGNNKADDSFWGPHGTRDSEEEMSQYLEANNNPLHDDAGQKREAEVDGKDSIAEPLYALMGEVFEMGGLFKWVRKSMISFVQITYGRTINRQIRESIHALFEETMLHHYVSTALTSFWPGGVLMSQYPDRSAEQQVITAHTAKSLLLENIPELFSNLVGQQTAKVGAVKIYETIQDATFNKQLFYVRLLENCQFKYFNYSVFLLGTA